MQYVLVIQINFLLAFKGGTYKNWGKEKVQPIISAEMSREKETGKSTSLQGLDIKLVKSD